MTPRGGARYRRVVVGVRFGGGVYGVCMARVNVSIPDDVIARARAVGLNVSAVATSALEEALERRLKIAMVDQYLAGIAAATGSMTEAERRDADAWLDSAS